MSPEMRHELAIDGPHCLSQYRSDGWNGDNYNLLCAHLPLIFCSPAYGSTEINRLARSSKDAAYHWSTEQLAADPFPVVANLTSADFWTPGKATRYTIAAW